MLELPRPHPYERRQRLDELHSFLRSVDGLRSDEALDELAKLFEYWCQCGTFDGLDAAALRLSNVARDGAVKRLIPLFAGVEPGHGGDLFQALSDVGVRAGMGQYFTPFPVAEAMANFLEPKGGEAWLDPFCGSGSLLGALTKEAAAYLRLYGIDRDPRVLHLARVEAVLHHPTSPTKLLLANALEHHASLLCRLGLGSGELDGIVTNPPFGAEVHENDRECYDVFTLASEGKAPLEVLGLEQAVRMLRPGGRMGIVLPQSVLSNKSMQHVRRYVLSNCVVEGVLSLPGETFGPYRGVSKASVLFLTRGVARSAHRVRLGIARSVGWDGQGKRTGASDVRRTAEAMRPGREASGSVAGVRHDPSLARNLSAEWLLRPTVAGRPLSDLCSAIFTGRSFGRRAYVPNSAGEVHRVLKVGDLTNQGIDWSAGERSFVHLPRPPMPERLLREGDLATTAAAHHPRYIAAKVDCIDCLPHGLENRCLPVAEVLILRPRPDLVDPIALLLWLRSNQGRQALRSCVTGQTAHLSADDVGEVRVPKWALGPQLNDAVAALRESMSLRRQAEQIAERATQLFEQTSDALTGSQTTSLSPL